MPLTGKLAIVEASNIVGGKVMAEIAQVQRGHRWRIIGWGAAVAILAAPFVAMQLNAEGVEWSVGDFIAMGVMLGTVGALLELAVRMSSDRYTQREPAWRCWVRSCWCGRISRSGLSQARTTRTINSSSSLC